MGTKALANNGHTLEEVDIYMASGANGPVLGPSHDGRWLILRGPTGRILRWVCIEAGNGCRRHTVPAWEEIARESGATKWLVK